ncbi:hypothetical protein QBA57_39750 [Streptomyces scabiei]|uniref:hypothetical protein n=1 Tax=Streptomyces scabiei TaxID=1930 RepID=UPI002FF303C9
MRFRRQQPQPAPAAEPDAVEAAVPGPPGEHTPSSPPFTCPRCNRTSHHPTDSRYGYCSACNDYTGAPTP